MAELPAEDAVTKAASEAPAESEAAGPAVQKEKKPAEFKGFFEHNLDAKSRLFIPAKFREQLGPSFTLCFAPDVPALLLYPDEVWCQISERINAPLFDKKMREVQRRTMSSAFDIEADRQGRITIPSIFKRYAKLESACIISGAGRKVEIWNPDAWYEEFTRQLELPEGEDDFGVSYDFGNVLER
ncbi:MAG TPA: division/cell wall cluster transcriptional repressor MraZ [Candidatus Fimivicinus intestinavium]|nr:division/cell wall cluster transcriptional repressor MraZ [Candidatus Fimivicinus intestinavium]